MKLFTRFTRQTEGATIIEFALVAPLFFLILMGTVEFGLLRFSQVAIEAAVAQASRAASIGTNASGCDRACTVRALVQEKTRGLINAGEVSVAATLVGTGVTSEPDICLTDPPSTPPACPKSVAENYQDTNNNGRYDPPGNLSLGNAGDLVELRVSFPWKVQMPFASYLFKNGVYMISSTTIFRNEP